MEVKKLTFKELLAVKKITQTGLASKIGTTQQLISKWTRGKCQPQIEVLNDVADVLGVDVQEVINCFK